MPETATEPVPDVTPPPSERVLLVDDAPTNLQVLYQTLDGQGYELLIAPSGEDALSTAKAARPDLILLDIMMPGIDGFETCRRLKADPETSDIAVIFMSALDETKDKVKGFELGAVDYITKPFQAAEVIARVSTHLTVRRLNRQLESANTQLTQSNDRMKRDLNAAAEVQAALLPSSHPVVEGGTFAWKYRPCDELAGDSLSLFTLDERHVGLYVVDVSGHGVPAALLAVMVTHSLSQRDGESSIVATSGGEAGGRVIASPAQVATRLNQLYQMSEHANRYFTFVYGVLDVMTGLFRYVCAGHPGPVRVRGGGDTAVFDAPDFPIGMVPDVQYEESTLQLDPGDRLYLHSDGVLEEMNADNVQFGRDRFHATLDDARRLPLDQSVTAVENAVLTWRGNASLQDDVTVVALEMGRGSDPFAE